MSDFQRPSRDLWDDAEEDRPTLVDGAGRPTPATTEGSVRSAVPRPASTLYERLLAAGVLDEEDADPSPAPASGPREALPLAVVREPSAKPGPQLVVAEEQELRDSDLELVPQTAPTPLHRETDRIWVPGGPQIVAEPTPTDTLARAQLLSGPLLTGGALGSIAPTSPSVRAAERPSSSTWGGPMVLVAAVLLGGFVGVSSVRHLLRSDSPPASPLPAAAPRPVPRLVPQTTELRPGRADEPAAAEGAQLAEPAAQGEPPETVLPAPVERRPVEAERSSRATPNEVAAEAQAASTPPAVSARPSETAPEPPKTELQAAQAKSAQAAEPVAPTESSAKAPEGVEPPGGTEAAADAQPSAEPAAEHLSKAEAATEQLSKADVVRSMQAIMPSLKACAGGQGGVADITLTVQGSGAVSYAMVSGSFAGTPEGSCIARAVKEARFPPFKQAFLRINYPVDL